jgi:hypothetical protein
MKTRYLSPAVDSLVGFFQILPHLLRHSPLEPDRVATPSLNARRDSATH